MDSKTDEGKIEGVGVEKMGGEVEMERERELKGKGNERYGQDYSQSSSLVYEVPAHHFSHHFTICGHHKALKWPITSPHKHTHGH